MNQENFVEPALQPGQNSNSNNTMTKDPSTGNERKLDNLFIDKVHKMYNHINQFEKKLSSLESIIHNSKPEKLNFLLKAGWMPDGM